MAKGKVSEVSVEALLTGQLTDDGLREIPFEQALGLLEELVTTVESGLLPLDKAITSYERGSQLLQHLRSLLTGAEEKLKILG
jgi:exodeoxyribonuclease VII small subunit